MVLWCEYPRLTLDGNIADTYPRMEPRDDPLESASNKSPGAQPDDSPLHEDDPELEREFRELAQWLLDVYLWKLHEERKTRGSGEIDNHPPPGTI